ncbi:MAG: hypothetical protein ACK5PZ_03095 [Pirellula sp.]
MDGRWAGKEQRNEKAPTKKGQRFHSESLNGFRSFFGDFSYPQPLVISNDALIVKGKLRSVRSVHLRFILHTLFGLNWLERSKPICSAIATNQSFGGSQNSFDGAPRLVENRAKGSGRITISLENRSPLAPLMQTSDGPNPSNSGTQCDPSPCLEPTWLGAFSEALRPLQEIAWACCDLLLSIFIEIVSALLA